MKKLRHTDSKEQIHKERNKDRQS